MAVVYRRSGRAVQSAPIFFTEPSRTRQEFVEDCDINVILDRFQKTGVLEHEAKYAGRYGDFLDYPQSLMEAENQVIEANAMFMTLPAKIREAFDNSPQEFLECVDAAEHDPEARKFLRELGLMKEAFAPPPGAPRTDPPAGGAESTDNPPKEEKAGS